MMPILFHVGSFPIYAFGFMVALGVILSLKLMNSRARQTGFPEGDSSFDMVFTAVMSGFLGARLYYILQNAEWYFKNPLKIFALWEGGLIFYGGMISAFFGIWVYARIKKVSFLKCLDFLLPYVSLSHAFGRIGCFLNGCCYGKACDLPWRVQFPELPYAVHPTQLYEAFLDVLLFLFLSRQYTKKHLDGEIAFLYFIFYAAVRFTVEFYRQDNPFWGPLTVNQWISTVIFLLAGSFYYFKRKTEKLHA